MQSLRYLNTVLTLLAVLLTAVLYTQWMQLPVTTVAEAQAAGLPDAGAQRQQIVDLLKSLNQKSDELNSMLKEGKARVQVQGAKDE